VHLPRQRDEYDLLYLSLKKKLRMLIDDDIVD